MCDIYLLPYKDCFSALSVYLLVCGEGEMFCTFQMKRATFQTWTVRYVAAAPLYWKETGGQGRKVTLFALLAQQ